MPTRRQFLQNSLTALSGIALSSCGWRLANVSPPSVSSDVLYLYTWAGYTDDDLLSRFETDTGFNAIADVFDSNEAMLARFQASGGGGYSIIYPSDYMVRQMADLDLLLELDKDRIVGLDRLYERFLNPPYDPGDRYSIPVSWGTTGLIYNSKKLPDEPEDWDYLWKNKENLKKKFTLLNDPREVMGATLKMLGYSYNSTNPKEIEQAFNKLKEIKDSIASFSSDAWRDQILAGDLSIAMCYSADASELIEENEDLRYILPASGSSLWADTIVIPKTAPNIDAAYQWINFMLQPEIAAEICERLSFATPNEKGFELLPKELQENDTLFPPNPGLSLSEGLIPLDDEITKIYDYHWTLLTSG
jgi:spermidine/putrescine transport system substrate-binding protein